MNWISVSDRLPEPDVDVLVFAEISGVHEFHVAHFYRVEDDLAWIGKDGFEEEFDGVVTHWTPLVGPDGETAD